MLSAIRPQGGRTGNCGCENPVANDHAGAEHDYEKQYVLRLFVVFQKLLGFGELEPRIRIIHV